MTDVEKDIATAIGALGFSSGKFLRLPEEEARAVSSLVKSRFVRGNPRVWWLEFQGRIDSTPYRTEEWPGCLEGAIRALQSDSCWFIVEADTENYPVYRCAWDAILPVLDECGFFEFYVVNEDMTRLVADTDHHNFLAVCIDVPSA